MKKINLILALAFSICSSVFGQRYPENRPSVYQQVDYVRQKFNLTQKQFEKLYSAYEKYNKAVFGNDDTQMPSNRPPQGNHHGGFGPGGPGGGNFRGHGGNVPGGNPEGMRQKGRPNAMAKDRPSQNGSFKPEDLEKLEKTKAKQEGKLRKSVEKIFNKDESLFSQWEKIREAQLKELFPKPPRFPEE